MGIQRKRNFVHPEDALNDAAAWENFDCKNHALVWQDRHYWFRTVYTVPQELDGKNMWIRISSQIDEWDDAKKPTVHRIYKW